MGPERAAQPKLRNWLNAPPPTARNDTTMDDDDAQFLVEPRPASTGTWARRASTQPAEHANYRWLVLGSAPANGAVVAAVAGAEVAPEPKRLAGCPGPAGRGRRGPGVAPYRMTGERRRAGAAAAGAAAPRRATGTEARE